MAITYFSLTDGSKSKLSMAWPSIPLPIPGRIRRRFRQTRSKIRSRQSPTASIASLNTSFNPYDTIRALQTHHWSAYDAQYLFLAVIFIFCLCIMESPGPFGKTLLATLIMTGLVIPISRQFLLPLLPVVCWFALFLSARFIPSEYRPTPSVRVLPALENILYGANLSNILSAHKSTFLDVLAWLPYGIMHYGSAVVVSGILFIFGPPGTVPVWARAFGYNNIFGVLIQLFFPCAPPWYENMYGLAPANYSVKGSAAGLEAIDKLFGIDLYTSAFKASPVVFGAFPSLHSGFATVEVLFMSHNFPKLRPLFLFYFTWLWWSTMYLSHHYAVDLVMGSLIAGTCYFIAKGKWLPRIQPGKLFRWDYDYVEVGDSYEADFAYGLADLDEYTPGLHGDSDEWTLGSSSSRSSGSREPSAGMRSPAAESWEGDTLASASDHEEYHKA